MITEYCYTVDTFSDKVIALMYSNREGIKTKKKTRSNNFEPRQNLNWVENIDLMSDPGIYDPVNSPTRRSC